MTTLSSARRPGPPADLLTADQERELARRRDAGDRAARDELIVRNLPLVLSLAARAARRPGTLDDIAQDATIGLVLAADRFDPARGFRFGTYATHMIRGYIQRARWERGSLIRVPCNVHLLIAANSPADPPRLEAGRRALAVRRASDFLGDDPDGDPFADRADDGDGGDPAALDDADRLALILAAVESLPARLARPLRLRFGLDGAGREATLEAVGGAMGYTKERARQVIKEGLERLRAALGAEGDAA